MLFRSLESSGGLQWPCYDESHPGETYLHGRLWQRPVVGPRAPFSCARQEPPVEELSPEFPLRLTTGRRLDSYNTGVQTALYASPLRRRETLDLAPEDARRLGIAAGDPVRVSSRRGAVVAPARIDPGLTPGLVFLTLHNPHEVATNLLTIDAVDPLSGTAEFKAAAVRVEKLDPARLEAEAGTEAGAAAEEAVAILATAASSPATAMRPATAATVAAPPDPAPALAGRRS